MMQQRLKFFSIIEKVFIYEQNKGRPQLLNTRSCRIIEKGSIFMSSHDAFTNKSGFCLYEKKVEFE